MKRTQNLLLCTVITCASLLLAPVATSATSGKIYTWTDENGTQHFGERPPIGERDFKLLKKGRITDDEEGSEAEAPNRTNATPAAAPVSAPSKQSKEKKAAATETGAPNLQDEEAALNAQVRAHNCKKAQAALRVLNDNARVRVKNEAGETVMLTDEQHKARRANAEKVVAESC